MHGRLQTLGLPPLANHERTSVPTPRTSCRNDVSTGGARPELRRALMELLGSPVELEVAAVDVSPEVRRGGGCELGSGGGL